MAQIASLPPQTHPPRISQLLPTVKCTSCLQPVPLAELGDHLCPPTPLSLQKQSMSPKSSSSFLPRGLQNLRIPPSVNYNTSPTTTINSPTTSGTPPPLSILRNGGTSHIQFTPQSTSPVQTAPPPMSGRTRTPLNATNGPKSPPGETSFPNAFEHDPPQWSVTARSRTPSGRRENVPVGPQVPLLFPMAPRTRTHSNAPSHIRRAYLRVHHLIHDVLHSMSLEPNILTTYNALPLTPLELSILPTYGGLHSTFFVLQLTVHNMIQDPYRPHMH
ncbi:hypothetical protein AZE42_09756 [Rhizopogon vesiculosus]|uniref:Uncharacterized protein n=1 Tax=Rhizopogon vesiculosus TaxID=180088 RepID=A0A1J8PLW2_9AGAM|nr:hypothetical protein AZE42_09756 [Rhizopogon vesiculosus]